MTAISKKKISYAIAGPLRAYLHHYDRETELPVTYADLTRTAGAFPPGPRHALGNRVL